MMTRADTPLIERVAELTVLDGAVGSLAGGTGAVVVLEAAAGLGKTALLDHAAGLAAAAGCLVRRAAPTPQERHFPFGVVRTLLEAPLRGALPLDGETKDNGGATAIAHGLMWLCAGLARTQPLALIVDDAQWSDRSSLEVLTYLAGRIEDLPLLIVVAARFGDPRAPADLLALLGGARSATVLHPQPLTPMGAARLIRARAAQTPIGVCTERHGATGGNPWLLGELAHQIETDTPQVSAAARAIVRRRLAELEPRDRAVAEARTVIGDGAPAHAIAKVASVALDELGPSRDALTAAGLLNPDGDGIAHPLIAVAIRDGMAPAERERLHRESARALIALGSSPDHIAGHVLRTRPHEDPEFSKWLRFAAAGAVRRGAPRAAVAYLERALAERAPGDDRGRLLADLAAAEFDAGLPDPRKRLRDALAELPDGPGRLDVITRLAFYGFVFGVGAGDADLLERELAAEAGRDPVLRRAALAHQAWLAAERGTDDADACAAMALEALSGGFLLREARRRAAYHLCIRVLIKTDRAHDARRAIAALRTEANGTGSVPLHAAAAAYAAELSLRMGHVSDAEAHARTALEHVGGAAATYATTIATAALMTALAERGEFDEARERAGDLIEARARLALAEGDFENAHTYGCDAGTRWVAALALAHLGRREEAVVLAETELAQAERFDAPVPVARALLARAVAEPDDQARVLICRRALAQLNGVTAILESVWLALELGRTLARMGLRVEARDLLRPALADADAVGASLLAQRARRELVATGLRPRRAALEGASALTPRQRQIIELAAAGKANRAIAQQLFLSIKTVETHLAAGYRKLGVNTRVDLSAAVAGRPRT
ncbi:MAG TPA: LuxR C-terminal-related transcriptional regulator [Solirubrobacteraceae bacterium]|jgi:DNA-binding CsgD family transcriptional regulator